MKAHWQYLRYVLRHKWYVFLACLHLGVPLHRAIAHDWTKFTPVEWGPYVRRFYGPKPPTLGKTGYLHKTGDDSGFDRAWAHHWACNPHHWQYWQDSPEGFPLQMPLDYAREMLADWIGAGLTQGKPDIWGWYRANEGSINLHPTTKAYIATLLDLLSTEMEYTGAHDIRGLISQ